MTTYKISVRPETKDLSLILLKQSTKTFTNKKESLNHAKKLIKLGWCVVNYNVDTYKDNVCIKNECSKYDGKTIRTYSTVNYSKPKAFIITDAMIKKAQKDYFNFG